MKLFGVFVDAPLLVNGGAYNYTQMKPHNDNCHSNNFIFCLGSLVPSWFVHLSFGSTTLRNRSDSSDNKMHNPFKFDNAYIDQRRARSSTSSQLPNRQSKQRIVFHVSFFLGCLGFHSEELQHQVANLCVSTPQNGLRVCLGE